MSNKEALCIEKALHSNDIAFEIWLKKYQQHFSPNCLDSDLDQLNDSMISTLTQGGKKDEKQK